GEARLTWPLADRREGSMPTASRDASVAPGGPLDRWLFVPPREEIRHRTLRVTGRTTPAGLVWQVMRSHPRTTLAAAVLTVLHQFGEIAVPVVVGRAVDGPLADGDARGIALAVALLVVVFCLLALGYRFGSRLAHAVLGYIDHEIRMLVTDRVTDHHGVGGGHRRPGDLLTVAGTDAQALARTKMLAVLPIGEIAAVVAGGAGLLRGWWPLGLGVLAGAVATAYVASRPAPLPRRPAHRGRAGRPGPGPDQEAGGPADRRDRGRRRRRRRAALGVVAARAGRPRRGGGHRLCRQPARRSAQREAPPGPARGRG